MAKSCAVITNDHAGGRDRQHSRRSRTKRRVNVGAKLVVLGGPAMNIGLGAARRLPWRLVSLMPTSTLLPTARQPGDGASLPGSDRPLLELGDANPILFIHDVGAGGLSTPCRNW